MRRSLPFFLASLFFIFYNSLYGWVYPEHRDIALIAIKNMNPEQKAILDRLWSEARKKYVNRLTLDVIDPYQYRNPKYLDFAAWPAISADHSCSAKNLLEVVLESDWILEVADIAAKLKIDLKQYGSKDAKITENALRDADILLQRADPNYATRAGTNNVHFLLSLNNVDIDPIEYGHNCIEEGVELNAIGAYAWYHYSALIKISRINDADLNADDRSSLILAALADEAFALHFLQDVFAAGHVAGTWGNASQRKGTHDYYNKRGLRTSTWEGNNIILTGDAYMRDIDAERAASVVKLSLEQFIKAASESIPQFEKEDNYFLPDSFNVCQINFLPKRSYGKDYLLLLEEVINMTPIPGLKSGVGELPRFRAELGLFLGISPALHGSVISGGFGQTQKTVGALMGIEASVKLGFGLDGVLNESGDGLIFISAGWREDQSSTIGSFDLPGIEKYGSLFSAIPGRSSFNGRIRLPFYLVPFDLLVMGPLLYITSPQTIQNMAVVAGNGGLIPWHSGISTSIGRFQFILGREVSVSFFGLTKSRDTMINLALDSDGYFEPAVISYKSTQLEFPILEYRPTRSFATNQSSTLLFQFFGGIDFPHDIKVIDPVYLLNPELKNIWFWGLRMVFDWRHYL